MYLIYRAKKLKIVKLKSLNRVDDGKQPNPVVTIYSVPKFLPNEISQEYHHQGCYPDDGKQPKTFGLNFLVL